MKSHSLYDQKQLPSFNFHRNVWFLFRERRRRRKTEREFWMWVCFRLEVSFCGSNTHTYSLYMYAQCFFKNIWKFHKMVEWTFNRLKLPPRCDSCHDENRFEIFIVMLDTVFLSLSLHLPSCWKAYSEWQRSKAKLQTIGRNDTVLKNGWTHKVPCKLPNFKQINTEDKRKRHILNDVPFVVLYTYLPVYFSHSGNIMMLTSFIEAQHNLQ